MVAGVGSGRASCRPWCLTVQPVDAKPAKEGLNNCRHPREALFNSRRLVKRGSSEVKLWKSKTLDDQTFVC
jgi:hypothetical protein